MTEIMHVAQRAKHSVIDARTTRHSGYAMSQRVRKRIEAGVRLAKRVAGLRKTKYRSLDKVRFRFTFTRADSSA